jgi:hypothetical protein
VVDPAQYRLIALDDGVIGIDQQLGTMQDRPPPAVMGSDRSDHLLGHEERNHPIRGPLPKSVKGAVRLRHRDFVAQERGLGIPRMGNEGFLRRQGELELVRHELTQPGADGLRLALGTCETEQEIVGVSDIAQPSVIRIEPVLGGDLAHRLAKADMGFHIPLLPSGGRPSYQGLVGWIDPSRFASGVRRPERVLDVPVQLMEVDVGQQWTDDPPLRRPAEGVIVLSVLHVPRFEQVRQQPKEPVIVDIPSDGRQEDRMVDVVEAALDVSLDEPDRPFPRPLDL